VKRLSAKAESGLRLRTVAGARATVVSRAEPHARLITASELRLGLEWYLGSSPIRTTGATWKDLTPHNLLAGFLDFSSNKLDLRNVLLVTH
jgi:hypothetical protein